MGKCPSLKDTFIAELLVADHLAREYPVPTARSVALPSLPGKADVVIGMRRSGKTWRTFQLLDELARAGVRREHTLYVGLEDDRIAPADTELLDQLVRAMERAAPGAAERWLVLDEIQVVPGWERFVRRLLDQGGFRVVLTGSSAKLLSRELATALRGRSLATELLPFSFTEALAHRDIEVPRTGTVGARVRARLEHELDRYLTVGGFPEVQGLDDGMRRRVLQEYVDVVLLRDVIERHAVSNTVALRHLARRLLRSPGAKLSVHRVHGELRGAGIAVGKDALHEYLAHLEDAFMVFGVPVDGPSEKRRAVNPRKFYLVDPALAWASSFDSSIDVGHRLENVVYLELRRRGASVAYHSGDTGHEVDFVASSDTGVDWIQVSSSIADASTRERELRAFESMPMKGGHRGLVITRTEQSRVTHAGRTIDIVPAWKWLLGTRLPPDAEPSSAKATPVRGSSKRPRVSKNASSTATKPGGRKRQSSTR